jgi:hypothetical protein
MRIQEGPKNKDPDADQDPEHWREPTSWYFVGVAQARPGDMLTKIFEFLDRSCFSAKSSVADPDPGSGAFLTPGSGIGFFRIPDLGSQPHIFENLLTIFWVKSSIIL